MSHGRSWKRQESRKINTKSLNQKLNLAYQDHFITIIHVMLSVCVYIYIYTHTHTQTHVCICKEREAKYGLINLVINMCMWVHTHIHVYIYIYTHIHTDLYIYIYIYTHRHKYRLVGFYGISTFVGYLTPNPSVLFQTIQFSMSTQFDCEKHFYFKLFSLFKQF